MSADFWNVCPVCHDRSLSGQEQTVRCDYDIYLEDNATMSIYVSFKCTNCGATWMLNKDNIPRSDV